MCVEYRGWVHALLVIILGMAETMASAARSYFREHLHIACIFFLSEGLWARQKHKMNALLQLVMHKTKRNISL